MDKKNPSEKHLSVIFGLLVSPSLINLMMALQTEYARKKKNYSFHSISNFLGTI
jgi:hypothetical protein